MHRLSSFGVSGTMHLILLLPVMMFHKRHAICNTVAETVRWGALFFWADGNILAAASNGAIDCIRTSATQFAGVPPDSQRLSGEGLWYVLHVEELPMYQCDSMCSLSWAKEVQPHLRFWFQWFWYLIAVFFFFGWIISLYPFYFLWLLFSPEASATQFDCKRKCWFDLAFRCWMADVCGLPLNAVMLGMPAEPQSQRLSGGCVAKLQSAQV